MAKYKVNVGIDYPKGRAEAGSIVDGSDLPPQSIKWLTEQGIIEVHKDAPAPRTGGAN